MNKTRGQTEIYRKLSGLALAELTQFPVELVELIPQLPVELLEPRLVDSSTPDTNGISGTSDAPSY